MSIESVVASGLCMQCGTCAGICPQEAVTMNWTLRGGALPSVDARRCTKCGACREVCPAAGLDLSLHAWWRDPATPNTQDFLGPWRQLYFGWANDPAVRQAGASGGLATALLHGAFAEGIIDAAICTRLQPHRPLVAEPLVAQTAQEVSDCRGSKYTMVAVNTALRTAADQPGRYALVGLPCHIQGLRLAQRRSPLLRQRIVLALGIFCGWSCLPQATVVAARRAGMDPGALTSLTYRGPGWPGGMDLVGRDGTRRFLPYPNYFDRFTNAYTPPRCTLCPDALAELADLSVGDAWLERFVGSAGVSDVIVRTERGQRLVERVAPAQLCLTEALPQEILDSQRETFRLKRSVFRGRLWLRQLARRPVPVYPGLATRASAAERMRALADVGSEAFLRLIANVHYR